MEEAEAGNATIDPAATVVKIVVRVSKAVSDYLVPQCSLENPYMSKLSDLVGGLGIVCAVYFSGLGQGVVEKFGFGPLSVSDSRRAGAVIKAVLTLHRLAVTGTHFFESTKAPAGSTRSAAILGEVSNMAACASTAAYATAVFDEEPETHLVSVAVKVACDQVFAGLQAAEAIVAYIQYI